MLNCRPGLHTRTFSDKNGLILDDLGEILGLKGGGSLKYLPLSLDVIIIKTFIDYTVERFVSVFSGRR